MAFWKIVGFDVMPRTPRSTQRCELTGGDPAPLEVVEPRRLAVLRRRGRAGGPSVIVLLDVVEQLERPAPPTFVGGEAELLEHDRRPAPTRRSGRCRHDVVGEAAPAERRRRLDGEGGHVGRAAPSSWSSSSSSSNRSQLGIDTTRTREAVGLEQLGRVDAHGDLAAGADEHEVEVVESPSTPSVSRRT